MTLRASLDYEPVPLKFGTSGRRGLVANLTQLEVYVNALAELEYLQSLPRSEGGIVRGEEFYFACDLRPSSCGVTSVQRPKGRCFRWNSNTARYVFQGDSLTRTSP